MYKVAIFGAGDLGGALARALATAGVVGRVTLIDDAHQVAAGKALDIRQSGTCSCWPTGSATASGTAMRRSSS
jgi:malate/lactate dehydrogenase